jgi:hypothetical protein
MGQHGIFALEHEVKVFASLRFREFFPVRWVLRHSVVVVPFHLQATSIHDQYVFRLYVFDTVSSQQFGRSHAGTASMAVDTTGALEGSHVVIIHREGWHWNNNGGSAFRTHITSSSLISS